jgi:hypothetical protein
VKIKRLVIVLILIAVALIAAVLPSTISAARQQREWNRTVKALRDLPYYDQVVAAVQAFVRSRKAGSNTVPATVTFDELVSGGYLRTNEVAAFAGKEVVDVASGRTFFMAPPETILIRVRMANGPDIILRTDGTIEPEPKR